MTTATTTAHTVFVEDKGYCWSTDHVLVSTWAYPANHRWGICFIPKGSEGRRVYQGPMEPGPFADPFGLATCIAANPEHGTYGEMRRKAARAMVHEVQAGDRVVLVNDFGEEMARFVVRVERGWLKLDLVEA